MPLFSRLRCVRACLPIICALLLVPLLAGCSAVKLAYNNLPELSYWWLDGYVDFDGAQTPRVRDQLDELLAWHRRNELPKIAVLLQKAQAMAPDEVTPAQACEFAAEIRTRLLAVAERAESAGTDLALSLGDAQLAQIERKYAKVNDDYRRDWLDRSPAKQQEKRYDQFLERGENFYGRLDEAQRALLRRQVAASVFDARQSDTWRRQRQQEALDLLRRLVAERTPQPEARAAIHAYVLRVADPPAGPDRERQQALVEEGCRNVAALHNATSAEQRAQAAKRLKAYEDDLKQLVAAR